MRKEIKALILYFAILPLAFPAGAQQFIPQLLSPAPVSGGGSLYYGYGCSGTSTNTCTAGGTTQGLADYLIMQPVTMGSNGAGYSVSVIGGYLSNSDGGAAHNMEVGIYPDSGGSGPDGTSGDLCHSSSVSIAAGAAAAWVEATPSSCPTLTAATVYWIAVRLDNASLYYYYDVSTPLAYYTSKTFGNWTAFTGPSAASGPYSIYVKVTPN